MERQLTEREKVLFLTIAIWLRGEMIWRLEGDSPEPDLLWDQAQSNFEIGCMALERAGILAPEDDYWRVLVPEKEQPALPGQLTRTDLDYLLDALACHSLYVSDLSKHHEVFTPTDDALHDVCRAMIDCGYMTAISANTFKWSDNFGPWLVRRCVWKLDEFEPAPQDEVDIALASILGSDRERLSSFQPDFAMCFFAQWIGGKWEKDEWRTVPSDDWDLNLAAGLYARLHGR